jgi:hypothetical protein
VKGATIVRRLLADANDETDLTSAVIYGKTKQAPRRFIERWKAWIQAPGRAHVSLIELAKPVMGWFLAILQHCPETRHLDNRIPYLA